MSDPEAVAADAELVAVDVDGHAAGVTTVVIDRPEKRNALNGQLREELIAVLGAVEASSARAVVLTGSEDAGAFVAGADVGELRERDAETQRAHMEFPRVYETVEALRQPVIARLNGHALGGGCELALACDVRIAREDAKFGQPEISLGLIPGGGATQRLPRLVGVDKAMELVLSGALVDGAEAAEIGLVTDAVPAEELDERTYGLAESMAAHSPTALDYAKRAVRSAETHTLDDGIANERELFVELFAEGVKDEGIDAFLEDREPDWRPS
ncbi:MAG: enoyl-CoA hydratase-related protein [Halobacteriales archaeon]|nr:enoyl-CoA hydratase-related protein [Halobacteriales archaeon]